MEQRDCDRPEQSHIENGYHKDFMYSTILHLWESSRVLIANSLPAVVSTASNKAIVAKSTLGSVQLGPGRTMKVGQAYDVKIELVGLKN
jgi:hypothetical protein